MKYAAIGPISIYLPEKVESNEQLQAEFPSWDMDLIAKKTGIYSRHIAAPNECASDLGVAAARKLFRDFDVDPKSVDFLLFCTQTPDYPLPTTACLMQERLALPTSAGALDFNLGCSGFVYGLSLAEGLIRTGAVKRILLITAETYSKYIHPTDRSLRTIFGDGAAATMLDAAFPPSSSEPMEPARTRCSSLRGALVRPTNATSPAAGSAGPATCTWTARASLNLPWARSPA